MFDFIYTSDKIFLYPEEPFHPDQNYPEFKDVFYQFDDKNKVYKTIRTFFINAGYDKKNIGTNNWNPFRDFLNDGNTVVIKPNLVYHETSQTINKSCLATHASVIRPIVDYLYLLKIKDNVKFNIIIADIPLQSADFQKTLIQTGLLSLQKFYLDKYDFQLNIMDLRYELAETDKNGFITRKQLQGDPKGYTSIHLKNSFLDEIIKDSNKFSISDYEGLETSTKHRTKGHHFYHISNTILNADLFINIPKLKTHQKAGITIALKNLIGINGDKSWIPHFRKGSVENGGDEYPNEMIWYKNLNSKTRRLLQGNSKFLWTCAKYVNRIIFKKILLHHNSNKNTIDQKKKTSLKWVAGGAWYGNDTLWRPILDLNYLLFYFDNKGRENKFPTRKYICITDGIISGEGNGPLLPNPKNAGILSFSENPVINDICLSKIMGYDWKKIPQLKHSTELKEYFHFDGNCSSIKILQCDDKLSTHSINYCELPSLFFDPPPGWIDHIEL